MKFGAGKNVPPRLRSSCFRSSSSFSAAPEEPIGIGALTLTAGDPMEGTMKSSFTMTFCASADRRRHHRRKQPQDRGAPDPDPRAPAGATMALDGKGKTAMTVRFGGIAAKVDGSSSTSITLKDPSTTPPRSTTNSLKVQHTLESK
ncbi:MAG: hypothetical protein U0235_33855 [Polyangiaceae bacterium]